MFASLVALDGFHLLLSTQLTVLTPEWCSRSIFHPLSPIYAKTPFCCIETVANNALNCQWLVVFDWLCQEQWIIGTNGERESRKSAQSHPLWTQLLHWQMFMQNGEYTAFWYLQLLYYLTQLQFTIGQNELVEVFFLCFPEQLPNLGNLALFVSVWPHLKSAYHLLTIVSNGAESE